MQLSFVDRLPSNVAIADIAACRALLRGGSRSFHFASYLLPRRVRDPAAALYAFCRLADDAIDREGGAADAIASLAERLDRAYAGQPCDHPVDRAFAVTVAEFAIPRILPEALIEGLEWDALGRRYETLADLRAYGARVAGTVGAMMTALMGARDPIVLARACDLGIAMQLTNIARDVGEDARAGRLYLPRHWMEEAGLDPEVWLAAPIFNPALASVVRRLLNAADELYARADAGIAMLPGDCQRGIRAARLLYAEIGNEVRRRGLDSVSQRAVTPFGVKLRLLARAMTGGLPQSRPELHAEMAACLEETRFLVEAVAAGAHPTSLVLSPTSASQLTVQKAPWWDLHGRAIWVVALFERLERWERRSMRATQTTTSQSFSAIANPDLQPESSS